MTGCAEPAPASPSPAALPSPVSLPSPAEPPAPDPAPFRDVDIVVPAWPAKSTQCQSGRLHLDANGQYYGPEIGKTSVAAISVTPVDFDGDGTDDYAVYLLCGEGPESGGRMIVGYRRDRGGLRLIGRIVGTQDGFEMVELMRRKGNAVEALVAREYTDGGQSRVPSQWRTYALRGKVFRQVGGPVSFPADPPFVRLVAQPQQVVLRTVGTVRTGSVVITVRNEGTAAAPVVAVNLRLPDTFRPAGPNWSGCTSSGPGYFHCSLANLAAGASAELSLQVLAPVEPPVADEYGVEVTSRTPDVFDKSTGDTAAFDLVLP